MLLIFTNISFAAPKVQIQVAPVAALLGASNLEVNYSLADKFSIGFGGLRWESELFDVEFEANEFHLIATYWKNGSFSDSWFGFIGYSKLGIQLTTDDSSGKEYSGEVDGSGTIIGSGYHWQWKHFSMQTGYSLGFYGFESELELEANDGEKKDESIPLGTVGSFFYNIGWLF
jgi:hypothetical protein